MKITSTNHMADAFSSFSVSSDADANQDVADIISGDFSARYTSAGSSANFTIAKTFSTGFSCKYLAIAGHNFGDIGGTLTIKVNAVLKETVVFTAGDVNSVVLSNFDNVTCTSIEVKFTKDTATDKATITYVSLGDLLDSVFNGASVNSEMSGYMRPWLTRSKQIRTVVNDTAGPVAVVRQQKTRKVSLAINNVNVTATNSSVWQDFLDRAFNEGDFFIKEEDGDTGGIADNPKSSYMCFDAEVMPPRAHPGTRKLNNLSIKFSTFTGY